MSSADDSDGHTVAASSGSSNPTTNSAPQRKTGLSCAECRRSKLKCDRSIPCQACVRRGCARLCPDGTLTATKGNKVLQAKAQKLGEEVQTLTARVKELEAALSDAQRIAESVSHPSTSHISEGPDREPDGKVKRLAESVGSMAINEEGASKYHGSTSTSEYLASLLPSYDREQSTQPRRCPKSLGLPVDILDLVYSFPLGRPDRTYDLTIFARFLPPRETAHELADIYWRFAAWQFSPIERADFYQNIFDIVYGNTKPTSETLRPHKLAIFFAILAIGLIWNTDPSAQFIRDQYDFLARAAFSLAPISRSVTTTTAQALFLINRFLNNGYRALQEECWLLHGVNSRVSQIIGLHHDGSAFDLDKEELQKRRLIFWELYTWDVWNGFVMGRVPAIRLEFADCKFPANDVGKGQVAGELGFHAWKYRYTAAFLPATIRQAFRPGNTAYASLMELDRGIRTFAIPCHLMVDLQGTDQRPWSTDAPTALQQCSCIFMKETNLLYLHRSYCAIAIESDPDNPLSHRYGASVMATYRSACRLCLAMKGLYLLHPRPSGPIWYFWSQVFSACVALAALVLGAPSCSLAHEALIELNSAIAFFEEGSASCRPGKTMHILSKVKEKAQEFYASGRFGSVSSGLNAGERAAAEEFNILNGRVGVIRHKSESPSRSPPAPAHETPRYLRTPPSEASNSLSLFSEQMYSTHMGKSRLSMMRGTDESSYAHALATPASSHEGSFISSRPSSVNYQETIPSFPSYNTNSVSAPQSSFPQALDQLYGYEVMDEQMAYAHNVPAYQASHPNDGLARRDVWSNFIDKIMTDPSPTI